MSKVSRRGLLKLIPAARGGPVHWRKLHRGDRQGRAGYVSAPVLDMGWGC